MPRKQAVQDAIYLDEAEGFILEHALISPPRTWPPLPPEPQENRLVANRKKMDWEDEVSKHPDEPINIPIKNKIRKLSDSEGSDEDDTNKERCVICLMALRDRTIVGVCGHEFCFQCIGVWANQSRRCPLCSADMAPFLLHDLDATVPTKFYLPPLPSRKIPSISIPGPSRTRLPEIIRRERAEEREDVEPDELDLQVERRREVYRYGLYVKHIGSNPTTKYRPSPTPKQISEDPILIQRATTFLRRELRVWSPLLDIEFMTTYIISLLKTIDIRSEPAIRLLADYLDLNNDYHNHNSENPNGSNAEHFSHEFYNFLRSPFKDLRKWDEVTQYDPIPSPQSHRSASPARSQSISRSISRSPSPRPRSQSRSPSPQSPPKRGRPWSRRDIFVPSVSPDAKRWNESDSWLDPEYAKWLEDEKQREEDRRERKRIRRASQVDRRNDLRSRIGDQTSTLSRNEIQLVKVELLPEPAEPPLRMDEVVEEPTEIDIVPKSEPEIRENKSRIGGLTIKGAAKSTSVPNGIEESIPTEPKSRRLLLDKLAKAKTAQLANTNNGSLTTNGNGVSHKLTSEEMKARLARLKAESAGLSTIGSQESTTPHGNGVDKKQMMKERLARLKAQSNMNGSASTSDIQDQSYISPDITSANEIKPSQSPPPIDNSQTDRLSMQKAGLRESIRRRISLKTKLQSERQIFIKNENESKAQELRRRLLENKARKEREQIENNFGDSGLALGINIAIYDNNFENYTNRNGAGIVESNNEMDNILIKMDYEERKKEIRRRLMRLKILNAETDQERRTRELKEKLLAKKRMQGNLGGVVVV